MGYLVRIITAIGMMLFSLAYQGFKWFMNSKDSKPYFSKENSVFYSPKTQQYEPRILLVVALLIMVYMGTGIIIIYSFKFSLAGGLNQGIVTTIFGLTPFMSAVMFYFAFKEVLNISQLIGMVFMIICIVMIGFGVSNQEDTIAENVLFSSIMAIVLALICPFFFAASGLLVRLTNGKYGTCASSLTET